MEICHNNVSNVRNINIVLAICIQTYNILNIKTKNMIEKDLDTRISLLEQSYKTLHTLLVDTCEEVKEIKEKLLARPSWILMILISGLTTLCGSLIVFIVTK